MSRRFTAAIFRPAVPLFPIATASDAFAVLPPQSPAKDRTVPGFMPKRLRRATHETPAPRRSDSRFEEIPFRQPAEKTGGKQETRATASYGIFGRISDGTVRSAPSQDTSAGRKNRGRGTFPGRSVAGKSGENRSLQKRSSARRNGRRYRFSNRLRSFLPRKIPARKDWPHARSLQRVRRGVLSGRDERNAGREPRNRHRPPRPRTAVASASRKARKRLEPHTKNPALFRERDLSKARRNPLIRS